MTTDKLRMRPDPAILDTPLPQVYAAFMRVLGIDPGLKETGYGILEVKNGMGSAVLLEAGLIRTSSSDPLGKRLAAVAREIRTILLQHRPDRVAIEDLYSFYKTPKPALLMGHVRGVLLSQAALQGIPVVSYLPTRVKKAVVGRGHASKEQVARMVQVRLGISRKRVPADVSDALAVALCDLDHGERVKGVEP